MFLFTMAIVLSVIGVANSLYFLLVDRRARLSSATEAGACQTVLATPYARVLGVPNSVFGLIFYASVAVVCAVSWWTGSDGLLRYAFAACAVALCFSVYLAYALVYKLHRPCPLCFLSHAINLLLVVLTALMMWAD